MTSQPSQQIPGVYRRKIGDITVTAISDGYLDGNLDVMRNVDLDKAHTILREAFRPARRTSVNTFLIHSKDRLAIIDTGSGNYLLPTAGFVQRNLVGAGIDPKSIDTVLLTHMHPDHSAGLTDMSNGELLFPMRNWSCTRMSCRTGSTTAPWRKLTSDRRSCFSRQAAKQVAPYKNRTRLFKQGEVFPGVTAVPSPGHTPGHTAYLIASGNHQLMIWGDTVHVPEVQTALPEAGMAFDTDLAQAAASRKRMFDRVSADGTLVAGMHLHFPGLHVWRGAVRVTRFIPKRGCTASNSSDERANRHRLSPRDQIRMSELRRWGMTLAQVFAQLSGRSPTPPLRLSLTFGESNALRSGPARRPRG